MNQIYIKKICYYGDNYFYESPEFTHGFNIITGSNGAGKSTFSDLIYFALGGSVPKFNSASSERHREITEDSNNSVVLFFSINGTLYKLIRKINTKDSNIVIVHNIEKDETKSFCLSRHISPDTFSDWILGKLGIPKIELFVGMNSFFLGFNDLLRLIYHNQESDKHYVLSPPDGRSNYINDSQDIRNTIFEVLTSNVSNEYYKAQNKLKLISQEYRSQKSFVELLVQSNKNINSKFGTTNQFHLQKDINDLRAKKVYLEKRLERIEKSLDDDLSEAAFSLQIKISKNRDKLFDLQKSLSLLDQEELDLLTLHSSQNDEIKSIERVIATSDNLGIFEPEKCPVCGNNLDRLEGKCICGVSIDEEKYLNFFYTKDDHNEILTSKRIGIRTTLTAIQAVRQEITQQQRTEEGLRLAINSDIKKLRSLSKGSLNAIAFQEIKDINYELRTNLREIDNLSALLELYNRFDAEQAKLENLEKEMKLAQIDFNRISEIHRKQMQQVIETFNTDYFDFLSRSDKEIITAKIDSDYMPVLNEAFYKNTAAKVPRRLFYYLTLLKCSLDFDIPFPRFLLIDTPQHFGIDADALKNNCTIIDEFCYSNKNNGFQILLTIKDDFVRHLKHTAPIQEINGKLLIKKIESTEKNDISSEQQNNSMPVQNEIEEDSN